MTAAPRTFSSRLKERVSYGALEYKLHPFIYAFQLEVDYEIAVEHNQSELGFLARVKLWLTLLWDYWSLQSDVPRVDYKSPANRQRVRRARRKTAATRHACLLGYHILRRRGLKACRQWIYKYSLIGRVRWCFNQRHWRRRVMWCFANSGRGHLIAATCNASLHPD